MHECFCQLLKTRGSPTDKRKISARLRMSSDTIPRIPDDGDILLLPAAAKSLQAATAAWTHSQDERAGGKKERGNHRGLFNISAGR